MTELLIGGAVWLAMLVVIAWALRGRDRITADEGDELLRLGRGAFTRRPTPPEDAPDEEDAIGR